MEHLLCVRLPRDLKVLTVEREGQAAMAPTYNPSYLGG
jgi:hypothetical protein